MLISRAIYIENENVNLDKGATETAQTKSACQRASLSVLEKLTTLNYNLKTQRK